MEYLNYCTDSSYILSHVSKPYVPGFLSLSSSDVKTNANFVGDDLSTKNSPPEPHSASAVRYGDFFNTSSVAYSSTHPDVSILRPYSGSTSMTAAECENHNTNLLQDF